MRGPLPAAYAYGMGEPIEEVQRAWLRQLAREVEVILYTYSLPMRPPALRLAALRGAWGLYQPQQRCIVLSFALLQQHDWDVVLEVLKHELAHQWVHHQGEEERPHGVAFAAAARRLGLADWAARASGELPATPGWIAPPPDARHAALHAKVRKLLALAGSSNEHEAALAMQRVREISARHALQLAEQPQAPTQAHLILGGKRRRLDRVQTGIVALLGEFFEVNVLYISQYDAADLQTYKRVEISGAPHQVQFAAYVYAFLQQQVVALAQRHPEKWRDGRGGRLGKASYQQGIVAGFGAKLAARPATAAPAHLSPQAVTALIRRNAGCRDAYQARRHPRVQRRALGRARVAPAAYAAGQRDGRLLSLHRPMTAPASTTGGRLLRAPR